MSLSQYEIFEACKRGELFTINNVRIVGMETTCPSGCNRTQISCLLRVDSNTESVLKDVDLNNIHIYKKPKYDPCRLLRKGDKVQVKRRYGRCDGKDGEYLREAFCKVVEDETRNELVRVLHNATEYRLDPAYLELVEPVEELDPYFIEETEYEYCVSIMVGERKDIPATYHKRMHPHAKASAEAERDRLNKAYHEEYEQALSHE